MRLDKINKYIEQYGVIILALIVGLIPLIVRAKLLQTPDIIKSFFPNQAAATDSFAYYKVAAFLLLSGILLIIIIIKREQFKLSYVDVIVFIYVGAISISTLLSISKVTSIFGYINRFESIFVLIGYIIVFLFASHFIRNTLQIKWIMYFWIGSFLILSAIGLTQFFGVDILMSDWGKKFILPKGLWATMDQYIMIIPEKLIYQTLIHYNYVGFYTSIFAPFILVLGIWEKKIQLKVVYFSLFLISIFNLFASTARNGIVGVSAGCLIIGIFLIFRLKDTKLKQQLQWGLLGAVIIVACIVIYAFVSPNRVGLLSDIGAKRDYPLNSILTDQSHILIDHDGYSMNIAFQFIDNKLNVNIIDKYGDEMTYIQNDEGIYHVMDSKDQEIPEFSFAFSYLQNDVVLETTIDKEPWKFIFKPDQGVFYLTKTGRVVVLQETPGLGFEGRERMGSARGYIWSKSLVMVKNHFWFGSGPDTFAISFPQDDYVGKYNAYADQNVFVDKPHSIYLDYLLNTGIFAFLAFIGLCGNYIYQTIRLLMKKSINNFNEMISLSCLAGTVGYLASGLFNDTNIAITPIFWVILGMGHAVNHMIVKTK